jgi:peptide/nickel transport system substrate-binding protein
LAPNVVPLESLVHLSQQQEYKPVFSRYRYDASRVARLMRENRCTLAPDGIWSCNGTRASIRFATTSGNARREFIQDELRERARAAGIQLVSDNSPSAVLVNTRLPAGDYELTMFAWLRTADAFGLAGIYGCDGAQNWMGYCSPRVTRLLEAAEADGNRPAPQLHRADAILVDDVPTIPYYQHPLFLASRTTLAGLASNAGPQGLLWNVEDWRLD